MRGEGIVDTHVHFWDPRRLRYPWLDSIPFLNRPFLPEDLRRASGEVGLGKIVFVQAEVEPGQHLAEAEWVTSLGQDDSRIQAIVAWAPLEKGEAAQEDLGALAEMERVRGIRRIIQFEEDIEFCLNAEFIRGVQLLPRYDLTFDLCVSHVHLENTVELVRQCPEVRFVLDHIAKPDIRGGVLDPWRRDVRRLSGMENVWCKISGLVTEADHHTWTTEDLAPYIDHVIECFGFGRVMYGGDWPVAAQASEYSRWVGALEDAVGGCSDDEVTALFGGNGESFYRI